MAWPKGATKKIEQLQAQIAALQVQAGSHSAKGTATSTQDPNDLELDIVLGMKVTREGPFHGLWQLYRLDHEHLRKIGAETSRLSVINLARNEIANYIP